MQSFDIAAATAAQLKLPLLLLPLLLSLLQEAALLCASEGQRHAVRGWAV